MASGPPHFVMVQPEVATMTFLYASTIDMMHISAYRWVVGLSMSVSTRRRCNTQLARPINETRSHAARRTWEVAVPNDVFTQMEHTI